MREKLPRPKMAVSYEHMSGVYSVARTLKDMLAMLPDADLAAAKREMGVLEDLLWQAMTDRRHVR